MRYLAWIKNRRRHFLRLRLPAAEAARSKCPQQ